MVKHLVGKLGEFILIGILLFFSWWLMTKSFSYDQKASQFRIARHEVGDFGLHISLIRSFAWGANYPPVFPFYPGKPMVYHYVVDWMTGQLVRSGARIDYAYNGLSAVALTILLFGMYRLTVFFTKGSRVAGLLSIIFFLLPSNLSFVEIFRQAPKDLSFFSYLWRFPDYLHKGPFDGSIITIYTTLAPYLNQRHLIAGMTIGVLTIWMVVGWLTDKKRIPDSRWAVMGFIIGAATRVHVVVAGATVILVTMLLIGKRNRSLFLLIGGAILSAAPHLIQIISVRSGSGLGQLWNPGYLSPRPLSVVSWVSFWVHNLGIFVLLIPLAYRRASSLGKRLMVGAGVLFLIANTVQVSYRLEHNHSLINYATVIMFPFIAYLLVTWWQKRGVGWKLLAASVGLLATASGIFNLMVVKNDYQFIVDDVGRSRFMQWIQTHTDPSSIFVAPQAQYDPVTITGRKNYLGHEYYVSVMGYDYWGVRKQIDSWLVSLNQDTIVEMKNHNIRYLAIPKDRRDFPYGVDEEKVKILLPVVYQDEAVNVYEL